MPDDVPLRLVELRRLSDLVKITPDWGALWLDCPTATPFERPEWALSWVEHFCRDDVSCLAVYGGSELLGLALWFRYAVRGERRIAFLGGGDSDYHEVLYRPGRAHAVVSLLHEHLFDARSSWDRCDFEQIPSGSPLPAHLRRGPLSSESTEGDPCLVLRLVDDGAGAFAGVPVHQLARYRKALRRIERLGRVSLCLSECSEVSNSLDDLFRFHTLRWQPRGAEGIALASETNAFLRAVAEQFTRSNAFRLYALRLDGRNLAVLYGFVGKTTLYCYRQGFDPEFSKWSPGMLIVGAVVQRAAQEGMRAVDFLRGSEPYKFAWGGRIRGTSVLRVRSHGVP